MTTTVYLASVKKLVILNTLQSTISRIMLNTISLFKPFQPGLSDGSSVSPRAGDNVYDEIKKQLSVYGLHLHLSCEGGAGNCFFIL